MPTILEQIEEQLGSNLQLFSDKLDLNIRQQDKEVLKALTDLQQAWTTICILLKAERLAKKNALDFSITSGNSVVDSLYEYARQLSNKSRPA